MSGWNRGFYTDLIFINQFRQTQNRNGRELLFVLNNYVTNIREIEKSSYWYLKPPTREKIRDSYNYKGIVIDVSSVMWN